MENIDIKKINNQLRTGKFNLIEMANIGEKCINFGDYILASKIFAKITELNKNNPATWCNLGVCLLKLHQYEDAENIFLHSLNINEKYYPSLINLCSVYQAIKNHKKQLEFGPIPAKYQTGFRRPHPQHHSPPADNQTHADSTPRAQTSALSLARLSWW